MSSSKLGNWGDYADDDDNNNNNDDFLPEPQVIGPDENGIKYNDDKGERVKIIKVRLTKRAAERRAWRKFGDAIGDAIGITLVSTEEILLERPTLPGKESYGDLLTETEGGKSGGAVLMLCRTCGKKGDHWTARCPYKDQLGLGAPTETLIDASVTITDGGKSTGGGAYVPPVRRAGAEQITQAFRRKSDENSVRVTNLSEDAREADLRELFGTFGLLERVYVAIDQKTGTSRGFGFVSFARREDAERSINKLNGYGYDNLILGVEWAAPRVN